MRIEPIRCQWASESPEYVERLPVDSQKNLLTKKNADPEKKQSQQTTTRRPFTLKKLWLGWDWGGISMPKSTGSFCGGQGFGSQHPHGGPVSYDFSSWGSRPSCGFPGHDTHMLPRHSYRQNNHTHEISKTFIRGKFFIYKMGFRLLSLMLWRLWNASGMWL